MQRFSFSVLSFLCQQQYIQDMVYCLHNFFLHKVHYFYLNVYFFIDLCLSSDIVQSYCEFLNLVKLNSGLYMVTGDSTEARVFLSTLLTLNNVAPQSFALFTVNECTC